MEPIALALWLVLYIICIYTDMKWHRIKNIATFPTAGFGLVLIVWRYGLRASAFFVLTVFVAGFITELFKIWGSGDTKLFISASLLSAVLVGAANPYFVLYFLEFNIVLYLAVGHTYTFYKSGFKPVLYIANLRTGGEIGKIPGALPIAISNIAAMVLYFALR